MGGLSVLPRRIERAWSWFDWRSRWFVRCDAFDWSAFRFASFPYAACLAHREAAALEGRLIQEYSAQRRIAIPDRVAVTLPAPDEAEQVFVWSCETRRARWFERGSAAVSVARAREAACELRSRIMLEALGLHSAYNARRMPEG